jgi:hypothetical protein
MAKTTKTKDNTPSRVNNDEVVYQDSEVFIKKLWNYDFFGIAYDYCSQRDFFMSKVRSLCEDYSRLDTYS